MSALYDHAASRKPYLRLVPKPDARLRYRWHREVLMANPKLTAAELRGGLYVFDRYDIVKGYADVSSRGMADKCRMHRKTAQRVIIALQRYGLIERINEGEIDRSTGRPRRARFVLRVGVGSIATPPR
jgi:hypothetical protein